MQVLTIEVPELGNRCHLVHDGARALVVDPPRDLGPVERAAEDAGVDIAAVADTHVHSDFLSGASALARRHRVPYLLSAEERVEVDRTPVRGGDVVPVGALEVRVIDTPGHTLHHQSFDVRHGDVGAGALFSGGSLLHGAVGRTDLVDPLLARLLGRAQWHSAQHQVVLPSATTLHPTHGGGSLCASSRVDPDPGAGTVGHERRTNPALTTPREPYVDELVAGFGPVPTYYRRLVRLNRTGGGEQPVPVPEVAGLDEVAGRARSGEWVLDVRPRAAYAERHLPGTVGIEIGDRFATYAGWVTPWGTDLSLVADRREDLDRAVHDLGQIGVSVGRVHLLDGAAWPAAVRTERVDWRGYAAGRRTGDVVVDVRHAAEHDADRLPGSRNVPLPDLWRQAAQLPPGRLWLHCRSGFRASVAAGLLERRGREVVVVDDDWSHAEVGREAVPAA